MDYGKMKNRRMAEKLLSGKAIDLSGAPRDADGDYILRDEHGNGPGFIEDKDYCDARTERWVWSIGQHWITDEIRASTDPAGVYYGNRDWKCLWLR